MRLLRALFRAIRNLFPRRQWFKSTIWVAEADDLPDRMRDRILYAVGTPERPKWAAFACPCRSGHDITLSLQPKRYPFWRLSLAGGVSLWPSVDVREERRCHFWVRRGRVRWVDDLG